MQRYLQRAVPGALVYLALAIILLLAAGCQGESSGPDTATPPAASSATAVGPLAQAEAEATAIVQQAQATALVLQAEAQAAAVVQEAAGSAQPAGQTVEPPAGQDAGPSGTATAATPQPQSVPSGPATRETPTVEIIGVGFAGEGGFIHVQFMAPPSVARRWNQGLVSVTDEETGIEYTEIPVMPVVGPLIGKPMHEGQPGYVMLVNAPLPLQPGARVTVKLGNYIEEGLIVGG